MARVTIHPDPMLSRRAFLATTGGALAGTAACGLVGQAEAVKRQPQRGGTLRLATASLGTAYDVSSSAFTPANDQRPRSSSLMFHGKKRSTSSGGSPPASAQAVRYAANHARGFNCHRHSVCNNENIIAAFRSEQIEAAAERAKELGDSVLLVAQGVLG